GDVSLNEAPPHPKRAEAAISLGLTFFAFFALLVLRDLFYDAPAQGVGGAYRIAYQHWAELGSLSIVAVFALLTGIWHVCDLVNANQNASKLGRLLDSYPLILTLLVFGFVGSAMIASGMTERLSCQQAEVVNADPTSRLFIFCTPNPTFLVELLVLPFLLLLATITMTKAISTLFGFLRRNS
ncbi:MAG: hypothetical protein AAF707_06960, partial [Pseudomonadota bacterium]